MTTTKPPEDSEDGPIGDEQSPYWLQMQQFAIAYADWESPTRNRKLASMQTVFPEASDDANTRRAYRWLKREDVQAFIEAIPSARMQAGKVTHAEFAADTLDDVVVLMKRGNPGDAAAAMQGRKLAAAVLGLLVTKIEDMTPPERRRPGLSGPQMTRELREQLDRIERLQKAVPDMPLLAAGEIEVVEVKPQRDTPWERPPGPRAVIPAAPQACFVCGADGFERGDGRSVCADHAKEGLTQQNLGHEKQARTDDYASPETEPGNPLP